MRMAVQMEEEGRLDQAAQHFIAAGKPAEAVAMYMHDGDWRNAEQIAKWVPQPGLYFSDSPSAVRFLESTRPSRFQTSS